MAHVSQYVLDECRCVHRYTSSRSAALPSFLVAAAHVAPASSPPNWLLRGDVDLQLALLPLLSIGLRTPQETPANSSRHSGAGVQNMADRSSLKEHSDPPAILQPKKGRIKRPVLHSHLLPASLY